MLRTVLGSQAEVAVRLWNCWVCGAVARQDDGPPVGWTQNLIPGAGPLCSDCQPGVAAKDLKPEKKEPK
jgi:hypothetical protein